MMENNSLTLKEIEFLESYKEPIDAQLEEMDLAIRGEHPSQAHPAHLAAELCMYHFTLGREYERLNNG